MHKIICATLTALALAALAPKQARSQEWAFEITPYVWTPSIDSSLAIGPNPPVNGSGSILDILDGAFLIFGEARRGPWSILGEFNYLNLSDEVGTTATGTIATWTLRGKMASVAAGYAFYDQAGTRIEALAGLRGWDIDAETTVLSFRQDASNQWVDPVVGLRFKAPLSDSIGLAGMANVGGFGLGSELQWDIMAQIEWSVTDRVSLLGGYRHLYLDFNDDSAIVDLTLSGPFVALTFNF